MNDILHQQAPTVHNDFSAVMDMAVYEKPQLISHTKDQLVLMGAEMLNTILQSSIVHVAIEPGDDGAQLYQLEEIPDIFTESANQEEALDGLARDLLEYAKTYYEDFELYVHAPNRLRHLPYVMRALALGTPQKTREMILCQAGKN